MSELANNEEFFRLQETGIYWFSRRPPVFGVNSLFISDLTFSRPHVTPHVRPHLRPHVRPHDFLIHNSQLSIHN